MNTLPRYSQRLVLGVALCAIAATVTAMPRTPQEVSQLQTNSTWRDWVSANVRTQSVLISASPAIVAALESMFTNRVDVVPISAQRITDQRYRVALEQRIGVQFATVPSDATESDYLYVIYSQMPQHRFYLMDASASLPWAYERLLPEGPMITIQHTPTTGREIEWRESEAAWILIALGGLDDRETRGVFATWRHLSGRGYMYHRLWTHARLALRDSILIANDSVTDKQVWDAIFTEIKLGSPDDAAVFMRAYLNYRPEDTAALTKEFENMIKSGQQSNRAYR